MNYTQEQISEILLGYANSNGNDGFNEIREKNTSIGNRRLCEWL